MKKRWYEHEKAERWTLNDITAQSYQEIYRILHDKELLELAACCMAVEEGFICNSTFQKRVAETLMHYDLKHDAATYLLYKDALTADKAAALFSQLNNDQGLNLTIPQIITGPDISLNIQSSEMDEASAVKSRSSL